MTYFALYEAYGTRPYEWGEDPDRFKANTKQEEKDLGLLNEKRRYRDLETGTFLTRDPIGYKDGPNRYCYVHCNPITHFDVLGLYTAYIVADYISATRAATSLPNDAGYADVQAREHANGQKQDHPDSVDIITVDANDADWEGSLNQSLLESQEKAGGTIDNAVFLGGHGNQDEAGVTSLGALPTTEGGTGTGQNITAGNVGQVFSGVNVNEINYGTCGAGKGDLLSQTASQTSATKVTGYSGNTVVDYEKGVMPDPADSTSTLVTYPSETTKQNSAGSSQTTNQESSPNSSEPAPASEESE